MPRHYTEEDWSEVYEERAGIMQYQGGLKREEAEAKARVYVQIERLRVTSEAVQARERAKKPVSSETKATEEQGELFASTRGAHSG